MAKVKTCRTCKYLDVFPNKAGKRVARKGNTYRCTVEVPEPVLPVSVTDHYNFRWPPSRRFMQPDEGQDCPLYHPTLSDNEVER